MIQTNSYEIKSMTFWLVDAWSAGFEPLQRMLEDLVNQVKGRSIAMAELTHAIENTKEVSFDEDVAKLCNSYISELDNYAENELTEVEKEEYYTNKKK